MALNVGGQFHVMAALPLGKIAQYPFCGRFGRPYSQAGCFGEEENLLSPPQSSAHSLVSVMTVVQNSSDCHQK